MLGLKFFSKTDLLDWLGAAGLSYEEIQKAAVDNLRHKIEVQTAVVDENKSIIKKAEAAITDATAQLKTANTSLKIVNKIGG